MPASHDDDNDNDKGDDDGAMMLEWAVFSSSVMEIALPLRLAHQSLTWKKNIRSSDHH